VDVLKVGHHGSRTSSSRRFLERTLPSVAVISVGRGNRYGHPHPPIVSLLGELVGEVYRTDRNGAVRVRARRDGSYRVTTER
jgi:competence protein ComEC